MKNLFKKRWVKIILIVTATFLIAGATTFLLVWNGVILLNNPSKSKYPVRGVDVSAYQGEIDWTVLSKQGIHFAYIKATEGSSFTDSCFAYNYENAAKTDLRIGAYHFFSFDSPGKTQAEHFINTVPKIDGGLPPVADVEFYGDKEKNPPSRDGVVRELTVFLNELESHYNQKPVIYTTHKCYDLYIADDFKEYDIWIRDVLFSPNLSDKRVWTFWQYTNRAKLKGYKGEEKFIDMNVFNRSLEEFKVYGR